MKAQELRIGNLIYYHGSVVEVEGVARNTIYHNGGFDSNIGPSYQPFKPIPLTEKWLKDLGFKKGRKGFWFQGGVEYNPKKFDLSFFGYVEIRSVNQLQNLYFALTGEDLHL